MFIPNEDTVWFFSIQVVKLFETTKQNVSLHINNVFKENTLDVNSAVKDFLITVTAEKIFCRI